MKIVKLGLVMGGLASLAIVGSTALAAAPPAGGPIKVFVTNVTNTKSKILVTGAIGDYGTTVAVDKNGKVDSNGAYQKVTLKKGGFWVNATALNKKLNKSQPQVNKATCSVAFTASAPTKLFKGSGLYAEISGTVRITVTFAGIAPRSASGQCRATAQPLGFYQSITGTGNAKF